MNRARLSLGRHSRIGQTYLLTTVTQGRRRYFEDAAAAHLVLDVIRCLDAEGLTHSLAYVVMPDHIHWLVELRAFSLDYTAYPVASLVDCICEDDSDSWHVSSMTHRLLTGGAPYKRHASHQLT